MQGILGLLVEHARLEVLGNAVRLRNDRSGVIGRENFVRGLGEEGEPTFEVFRIQREL